MKFRSASVGSGKTPADEKTIIRRVSFVGIFGNIVLTAFKLAAGVIGRSGAMVSDAVHSMSDVLATIIAFVGVTLSKKDADREHPYGHERFECVASLALGLILAAAGFQIGRGGIMSIIDGSAMDASPGLIALIAALVSIVSKELMYRYTMHCAKMINSAAFAADAWHHRSDAFSSIGSLIGIGGAMLGVPVLDSIASIVICVFIIKTAADILRDTFAKLLDTSSGEDFEKKLRDYIERDDDVIRVDTLRSRQFGSKVYVDLEIEVDGDRTLRDAHEVAKRVHANVERDFPNVKHIMIHLNPDGETD